MTDHFASDAIRAALGSFEPSAEQWEAIAHPGEPVAVVAGAGTGKTAVMAARIVWMVEDQGIAPSQVLGLTFTNRAAQELEERVASAFRLLDPPPAESPEIFTYNAFADRIVRAHGVRVGIDPEVGLLSEAQRWQLVGKALEQLPAFEYFDVVSTNWICQNALGLADSLSNHDLDPETVIAEDRRIVEEEKNIEESIVLASHKRIELMGLVSAYIAEKRKARRIDFGDQVTKAVEILKGSRSLAEDFRKRYPVILLDEYQDTNIAQRKLLQKLAPQGHNITAVGDARQNIYQWRGSTIFNLIDFPTKHFLRDGEQTYEYLSLAENFRSGSRILGVANQIMDVVDESRRPGKPLVAHEPNGEGSVSTALFASEHDEANFIANEIERLHGTDLGPLKQAPWSEFAVLVRRKALIKRIYEALRTKDIPVEVVGLGGLMETPEVLDTVAWLRVVADPGPASNRWLARLLLGPRFRIHYRDIALLARWSASNTKALTKMKQAERKEGLPEDAVILDMPSIEPDTVAFSLAEALDHLEEIAGLGPEAIRRLQRAEWDIKRLRELRFDSLLEFVRSVVSESGIAEELQASQRRDGASAMHNLSKFTGMVGNFQPVSGDPSLPALLEYLDAIENAEENLDIATPSADDSVKLMTVHQAKGLEFGSVFVPGVAARVNNKGKKVYSMFPDARVEDPSRSYGELPYSVREDREHLPSPWIERDSGREVKKKAPFREELHERAVEDERRLFYVSLTRAKQRLYVTASHWYGKDSFARGPSDFFDEVAGSIFSEQVNNAEAPKENPMIALLAKEAVWPPTPEHRLELGDPFPDGYPAIVEALMAGLSPDDFLATLDTAVSEEAAEIVGEHRRRLASLKAASPSAGIKAGLTSLSATNMARLASGSVTPDELQRRLPERSSVARSVGTEIHRLIEEKARGLTGLADEEAMDEPSEYVEPSKMGKMLKNFNIDYDNRKLAKIPHTGEPMSELPFVLKVGDVLVRGRIDAIYETEDGGLEVVDFKSGREVGSESPDQLDVYAAALKVLGVGFDGPLKLTYFYLATGKPVSRSITADDADRVLERLERSVASNDSEAE
jgi:DNA helicase-2/ATP-dependent DNA helicase PcrA